MREQVASPSFTSTLDRKKMSLKISGRDENNEQRRRLNGGYVTYFGEKPVVSIHLKGGSSVDGKVNQDLARASPEKTAKINGLEKTEKANGVETVEKMKGDDLKHESQKRRALDDDLLLQWGHRKRSRCSSRPELKHITDESSLLLKETVRVERRVVKAEKQLVASQTHSSAQSRSHATRPFVPPVREVVSNSGRRSGQDLNMSLKGTSASNKGCIWKDVRHSFPKTDRSDQHGSDKNGTAAACPPSNDNRSPDNTFTMANFHNGDDTMQTPQKMDLDLFEWPRITISLSRKEKEDDFMAMKGCKLSQRPKRRPKVVEKALHYCFPGNWLSDLTRGRYDVREKKCVRKKPRGLKAMESSDSDSE